jgi:signal transduction histidine kinase
MRGDDARNIDETTSVRLGLSIARSIVLRHGGRLSLSNRKPNGPIARVEFAGPATKPAGGESEKALCRDRLGFFGLIEIGDCLKAIVAGHASPQIEGAARFGFNPFGE